MTLLSTQSITKAGNLIKNALTPKAPGILKFKTSRLLIVMLGAILLNLQTVTSQTLIAGWDFQTTTSGGTAAAAAPNSPTVYNANVGTGTIYLDATNGSSGWLPASELNAFGGTILNAGGSSGLSTVVTSPSCLALLGGAAAGATFNANGKMIILKFSMTGFVNLSASYATQKTSTGFNSHLWEYSTDGTTWVSAGTAIAPPAAFAVQTLSTITGLNNIAVAYLRVTFTGATAAAGNNRLDNIQLNATSSSAPTFYNATSSDVTNVLNWWSNTDGATGSHPSDFTTAGQIFNLTHTGSFMSAAWTVSGAGSKVVLGNGTSSNSFTIPATFALTGTTDVSSLATLNIANVTNPTLGALATTGTVVFNATAAQTVPAASYGNLTISTTGGNATMGGTILANNLTLSTGSLLSIGSFTLTLNGAITGTGLLSGSLTSNLTISGAAGTISFDQTSNVTRSLNNLTLTAGSNSTLGTAVDLYGVLTATTSTFNMNGQNLTVKSVATATARIANLTGSTISGATNVTVERYIPANTNRAWRLLSIPTTTTNTINAAWQNGQAPGVAGPSGLGTWIVSNNGDASFDAQFNNNNMLTYLPATNQYAGVANTTSQIATDKGYMLYVRGDRTATNLNALITSTTLKTTGSLRIGSYPVTPIAIAAGKFDIIGNPYPSQIDFRNVTKDAGLDNTFYLWDPKLAGVNGLGAYQTCIISGASYVISPGGGSYGINGSTNNTIQSGMAFFVHATTGGAGVTNAITFLETSKASGIVNTGFNPVVSSEQFVTNLYAVNGGVNTLADGNLVLYDNTYSNSVDANDALKLNNFGLNLGLLRTGNNLSVEKRQIIGSTDTVFYNITGAPQQQYQLEFIASNLNHPALYGFLQDTYLATTTPLNLNGSTLVNFTIDANPLSGTASRFRVVFSPISTLPISVSNLTAHAQNTSEIMVEWSVENERNMQQYEVEKSIDGVSFTSRTIVIANNANTAHYRWLDANAVSGYNYYRIKSVSLNGEIHYSFVVKVLEGGPGRQEIIVYPNPVTDGRINLQLNNMPAGSYGLKLFNAAGQVVFSKQVMHQQGSSSESIYSKAGLAKGIYQLEVTKPDMSKNVTQLKFN